MEIVHKCRASIGIIINHNDNILITKIPPHKAKLRMGDWEFPGGTIEDGETPEMALLRELKEEVGIEVLEFNKLICYLHSQSNHESLLEVFLVTRFNGSGIGLEGQETKWVNKNDLLNFKFTLSHQKIIEFAELKR